MRIMLICVLFLCSLGLAAHDGAPHYLPSAKASDLIVARGTITDAAQVQWLQERFDVWLARRDTGQVDVMLSAAALAQLQLAGLPLQKNAELTATLATLGQRSAGQVSGIPGFACYRTVEETQTTLQSLAATHPALASVVDIGDSWNKANSAATPGYDLLGLRIHNPLVAGPKAPFYLMGAIHAREYTTAEVVTRFAETLLAGYGQDAELTWLIDHSDIYLFPQSNPDGRKRAEAGALWRRNLRPGLCNTPSQIGVDLNRNSSYLWGIAGGSSTNPCSDTFRGPAARSEPEVAAIEDFLPTVFSTQRPPDLTTPAPVDTSGLFITLHSYTGLVLFPWGALEAAAPNRQALQTLGRKFGFYTQYQVCQAPACLYAASGVSDDFAYGRFGVASYTFEIGSAFFQSCSSFEAGMWTDMRSALRYGLKAARRPYAEPQGPEVVDLDARLSEGGLRIRAGADGSRFFSGGQGNEPTATIASVRAWIDVPSFTDGTGGIVLPAADGGYNSVSESIDVLIPVALAPGRHALYVVATDINGRQGVPSAVFFEFNDRFFTNGFESITAIPPKRSPL